MAAKPPARPEKDKPADPKADKDAAQAAPARKLSLTTILVVAGVLLLEVGTVLVVLWLSRGPAKASAATGEADEAQAAPAEDVEELIVEGKAANTKRGSTYVYRFKVHAVVGKADQPAIAAIMQKRKASIEDTVRQAVARLEPKDLDDEPELATLRRVLMREFEQIFGAGKIKQLLVPEWTRFKADY